MIRKITVPDLLIQAAWDGAADMDYAMAWYFGQITDQEVLEDLERIYSI